MNNEPQYQSITVAFRPDGTLVMTRVNPGGTKRIQEEKYRIVGQPPVINKPDYIMNAQYAIYGNEMVITAENSRAVMKKLQTSE